MHLVNLSLDQSLFSNKKVGDSHNRFVAYSKIADKFTVIVPTTRIFKRFQTDSIEYIPATGKNKFFAFLEVYKQLNRVVGTNNNSIVISNDPVLGFVSLLSKLRYQNIKIQINSFGSRLNQWQWILEKPHHLILWLLSFISLYFADSVRTDTWEDKMIIQKFIRGSENKFIVLPVPPSKEIQKKLLLTDLKLTHSKPTKLLAVGSLTKNKDFDTLLKAIKLIEINNFHLTIIGSGPEAKNLKKLVSNLNLNKKVTFIPNISYSDLLQIYKQSDILVSSSKIEGLPRVLQEAALAGLPIITTNFNGAKDFIRHNETGLVVDIGNNFQLAEAIKNYLNNPNLALKHAKKAREFAKNYCDFDRVVSALHQSWKNLEEQK